MIEIKNMNKSFGDKVIFKDFNLEIKDQEFVVLSGKSGSGKTTLLNIIGGIEKVDSGEVLVDNQDITKEKNLLDYFRYTVGFLFQNFALIERETVYENLKLVKKRCRTDINIEEALEKVGLSDKKDQKVYTLSGGEQQRVALARLLIKKCKLILADEPTGSLDRENANMVISILKEYQKMGKTVCLVTHDDYIKTLGDRVVNL
ncbi:TPA: ABC transporter ATP-binding protein [Streptococcus agalactiae]|nr:ABC transporter ATP-binding protein [Streptococcus agalactiae]